MGGATGSCGDATPAAADNQNRMTCHVERLITSIRCTPDFAVQPQSHRYRPVGEFQPENPENGGSSPANLTQ
jgi:hypothetical protein